ncbi:MAG: hypothetical protein ACR2IE_05885 [Candidatus Sumerlaeaceae bacterium]
MAGRSTKSRKTYRCRAVHLLLVFGVVRLALCADGAKEFHGQQFSGRGDLEYLQLLDIAARMLQPDPEFQNLSMLYTPEWNGLVEGPTWNSWWIQNSYGTTYCALPFLQEPFLTFLQNSHDQWFDQMGDGKRAGEHGWVAPDGCLCDCARPGQVIYKQGDGRIDIHDWAMEFTAAGILLQSELLLIGRDPQAIAKYLPKLERSAAFIETRRDSNDLFLAGPAANLLAPSYAGWKRPDGTYGKAWLTGLSVTYIAALERLSELCVLAGDRTKASKYRELQQRAQKALAHVQQPEGYFIRSLDPDGTRHGAYGAARHGYFEASPNHDAIAFRVVRDAQAEQILKTIESIPGLRPHHAIIANYPAYDDMYTTSENIWTFGTWVNGGHWSTCEARMVLAYYRTGRFADARKSMEHILGFARRFRLDNPLTKFGSDLYQPQQPINLCYDSFGPPMAFLRGLFETLYTARGVTVLPHVPPGITELEQRLPVRLGAKRIYLHTVGSGTITAVEVNGTPWRDFTSASIDLRYDALPENARVLVRMGGSMQAPMPSPAQNRFSPGSGDSMTSPSLAEQRRKLAGRIEELERAGAGSGYKSAHARLAVAAIDAYTSRTLLLHANALPALPEHTHSAALQSYLDTAAKLSDGLEKYGSN